MQTTIQLDPFSASIADQAIGNVLHKGPNACVFEKIKFNSQSASGAEITIRRNSGHITLVDKRIYIQAQVRVTSTAAIEQGCPKSFPLNKLVKKFNLTINNQTLS